jgi:proteasome lid subunit RPN8/RPN11
MISTIRLQTALWELIEEDVRKRLPEEACGLIAGRGDQATDVIPIENVYHSPYRYRMDPKDQLSAFQHIEAKNWELLAIYHSHPDGPGYPSETDINEAYYPETVYVIVSRSEGKFIPRAYFIKDAQVLEIKIVIEQPQ